MPSPSTSGCREVQVLSSHGTSSEKFAKPDSHAFEVVHDHGSDQPREHSVVLDGRTHRTRWRTIDSAKYIPASIFPAVYVVHRLYRNYRPRRLPTLTSLTLLELYAAAATPVLVRCLAFADAGDAIRDKDRHTIVFAGRRLRRLLKLDASLHQSFRSLDATLSQTPAGREVQARLRWLREGEDRSGNIIQRVVWWYRHPAWTDQSIWNGVAMLMLGEYRRKPGDTQPPVKTSRRDWDLCVTYMTTFTRLSQIEEWREKARNLFAASLPVSWLARFSGRPLLYLPMSAVQRLLLGTFLYADWASTAGMFQYVRRIRDKATFARLVTAVFGDFEKELLDAKLPNDEGIRTVMGWFE
ncbi:hypothetical protein GSI_07910 [Ganoderma sinense ZZ0214-1]|uniref:Uncharacterized protein n=1 Tax=Ganoderma sinense ZZ0214-1 TaxID=1077348 RepID=A0A2G8S895_9APHY|nr:hypothetical protein GSI_07910 [Ganoderma sinense ZZ0214-1]